MSLFIFLIYVVVGDIMVTLMTHLGIYSYMLGTATLAEL